MVISHHLPLKRGYKSHSKPFKNLAHQKHCGNNFTGVFLRVFHPAESESGLGFVQKTLPELLQYLHSLLVRDCSIQKLRRCLNSVIKTNELRA